MTKSRKLQNLFSSHKLIRVMGAHNALSAKLVEKSGFDAVWASGLEISTSYALPDANLKFRYCTTLKEGVEVVKRYIAHRWKI
jgi:2-methylisocitrate lyase-like PEP mutase family enzyme